MKLYSWNINGYNTCNRYGGFDTILQDEPDIICFQEVKVSDPEVLNSIFTLNYNKYYNFSERKGHNGVFVYSKELPEEITYGIGYDRFDKDGRIVCLEYNKFILINLYMPHGGRDKCELSYKLNAYSYLFSFLNRLYIKKKPLLLAGDFNIAHTELDLERSKNNQNNIMFTIEERNCFSKLLSYNLSDVYRELHPDEKRYTWWPYAFQARERNIGWRIDYLLVSKNRFSINDIELCYSVLGSDHCPIKMEFVVK